MLKTLSRLLITLGCLMSLNACSGNTQTWDEEVKLLDGRVIVVTQKRLLQGLLTRDAWLTIRLPEFSAEPIVWHEALDSMVVNVFEGHLYLVAMPPTEREFHRYGRPVPSYIGYRWNSNGWERIAFSEIPEKIYDANMLVNAPPDRTISLLTLDRKNSNKMNFSTMLPASLKRIDPKAHFFN